MNQLRLRAFLTMGVGILILTHCLCADAAVNDAAEAWKAELSKRSRWWSLQSPKVVSPPVVLDPAWAKEPVDRFVFTKLTQAGLTPAEVADAETLLRRLSFVLTGLPPEPNQVGRFRTAFRKNADSAIGGLVDELLTSPQFGERFARHWMDVVRYTDTYGYEWDVPAKGSWEYRDYLIRAFNDDIGFDQLIREQIAGDLLPQPRINTGEGLNESLIGPMFYHLGEHRHGSSLAFNGIHQEMINNKIDAFSKAFLGMTVACARCHDHKLDAVSQADYYALAGVFMTPRWTARSIDAPGKNDATIEELKRLRGEIRKQIGEVWSSKDGPLSSGASLHKWALKNQASFGGAKIEDISWPFVQLLKATDWLELKNLSAKAAEKSTELVVEKNGAILARGDVPETDSYTVSFTTGPGAASLIRLEALTHESLGSRGPGRTAHGNFVLTHVRVEVKPVPAPGARASAAQKVVLASARADYSQPNYPIKASLDPAPKNGWGVGLGGNINRTAWFTFAEPMNLPHGGEWTVTLEHRYGSGHVLGRFRLTPGLESTSPRPDAGRRVANQTAIDSWQRLAAEWIAARKSRQGANKEKYSVLTDFSQPGFPEGWVVEGDGIRYGHVKDGALLIGLEGEALITQFLPRGYHTHALSSKLPGALRLPAPESFPRARVSLELRGGEWAGQRVIPENAFLNEAPTYFDPSAPPGWTTISATALKNGVTRALTEITTASLNSNFPGRTGIARAGKVTLPSKDESREKRSWFSITGIVAHDGSGAPVDSLDAFGPLYEGTTPATVEEVWQRMANWLSGAIDRWVAGDTETGDVKMLNWLLAEKLLSNDAKTAPKVAALVKRYREVEDRIAFPRSANSMDEREIQPVNYRLNLRGNVNDEGPAIRRDFLEVFSGKHDVGKAVGSGRLELARYLSSRDNPQTARVFVNRVWQWMFGTGIVATSSDFGKLGDRPSHPELLDWLANQFMKEGWSIKRLVKRLALSRTFRQSGNVSREGSERDADNRLLHHYPTRRLEAEAIRDNLLAVSGRLDRQLYGPPINPPRVVEDAAKRLFSGPLDSHGRRSIYLEMSIMQPPEFLTGFNLPDLKLPTGKRDETNVPAQALTMLNDPFVNSMASHWAKSLVKAGHADPAERLRAMFITAFGREPVIHELTRWRKAVVAFGGENEHDLMANREAWTALAHTLFNTKEFLYYR